MNSTDTQPVTHAFFDRSAVYEPVDGPDAVEISGTAYNATNIASIQITDNGTPPDHPSVSMLSRGMAAAGGPA